MSWLSELIHKLIGNVPKVVPVPKPAPAPTPSPSPKPAPAPTPPLPVTPSTITRAALLAAFNAERAKANTGLHPYGDSARLDQTAQTWSEGMAASRILTHGDFAHRLVSIDPGAPTGEDIGEGQRTVAEIVADWMESPGHRAQILSPSYGYVGFGWSGSADGTIYWTADFSG